MEPRKTRRSNERFIELALEADESYSNQAPVRRTLVPSESSIASGTPTLSWEITGQNGTFVQFLEFRKQTADVYISAVSTDGETRLYESKRAFSLREKSASQLVAELNRVADIADAAQAPKLVAA